MSRPMLLLLATLACGPSAPLAERSPEPATGDAPARTAEPIPTPEVESPSEPEATESLPEPERVLAHAIAHDGAPSPRMDPVAVANERFLFVWGGDDAYPNEADGYAAVAPHALADGGRYDLSAERWASLPTRGAPSARYRSTATWTGQHLLVWGGLAGQDRPLGDGGRYDPERHRWLSMARRGAPSPRVRHTFLWIGSEVLVWGGRGSAGPLGDGARYDPARDQWRELPKEGAPSARHSHSAVWTGSEMIVWGGVGTDGLLGDGARFDPATGRWTALPDGGAPSARHDHVAVWTGEAMLLWGGVVPDENGRDRALADGATYDPATDTFRPMATERAFARVDDRGHWTGSRLVVLGEVSDDRGLYPPPSLGVYDPAADSWSYFAVFASLDRPLVLGKDELLFWGGHDGTNMMAEGLRVPLPPRPR